MRKTAFIGASSEPVATAGPRPARRPSSLAELSLLSLSELRRAWPADWGPAPSFRSRDLLHRAFAYRLQTQSGGQLTAARRRQLAELADRFHGDRRFTPVAGVQFKPGSALIREWRGVRHEVVVTDTGFTYAGETFTSLSKIARHITGTAWNGHIFFGLKSRPPAKP
jgi:hypothetical protein